MCLYNVSSRLSIVGGFRNRIYCIINNPAVLNTALNLVRIRASYPLSHIHYFIVKVLQVVINDYACHYHLQVGYCQKLLKFAI